MARSAPVASFSSTIRSGRPFESRTTRPYPRGASSVIVANAMAAFARPRAATTRRSVSSSRRGVSPERIAIGPFHPRSAPFAASTACAVPSCCFWTAKRIGAPGSAAAMAASTASA